MMKSDVRTKDQAYAYILDCNLATVQSMAMLKSRKKGEYKRQILIAQTMLQWALSMDIDISGTRAEDLIESGWPTPTVAEWASRYEAD